MAIFNIYLDLDTNYKKLIKDIYKIIIILIVFQILIFYSDLSKNFISNALTGSLLNDEFMTFLILIIISYSSYYLVFDKILEIN